MRYEEPAAASREDLVASVENQDTESICESLISLALSEPELDWIQDRSIELLDHPSRQVRISALIGIGHLARLHRKVDKERLLPRLRRLAADPAVSGYVESTRDDIDMFVEGG